jgi:hypothetical protein
LITSRGQVACGIDLRHALLKASITFDTDPTSLQLLLGGLEQLCVESL